MSAPQRGIAVVTGGAGGIGSACVRELVERGYDVVAVGRKAERLEALLAGSRGGVSAFQADVRDWERLLELRDHLLERYGRLDVLVNCAGGQFVAPASEITPNGWRAVVDTNLTGTFQTCQALRELLSSPSGSIVNVVANVWQRAAPGMAHSGAARAGVISLTRTLAVEWAPAIRVNALSPGLVDTPALRAYGTFDAAVERVPAARAASPEEIAGALWYLVSPEAGYVTGSVLVVDGGLQLA